VAVGGVGPEAWLLLLLQQQVVRLGCQVEVVVVMVVVVWALLKEVGWLLAAVGMAAGVGTSLLGLWCP
jgi:hypothetical protein